MLSTPSIMLWESISIVPRRQNSTNSQTLCVHAGAGSDPLTGAVMTPIYWTSTYAQKAPGVHKGFEYSRTSNPTRQSLEIALAQLEKGNFACAFASGLAAEDAVLHLLSPGDEVLVCRDLYGGTYRLMMRVWKRYGLNFKFINTTKIENTKNALNSQTKMVWIETPSNPLLRITDIKRTSQIAKRFNPKILIAVDNTFATPILQNPLTLGADICLHSTTKYIGGHSDVVGGAVITANQKLDEQIRFHQNALGAVPSPADCFLTLRGIKTLSLRVNAHNLNGRIVSGHLKRCLKVSRVYYPGFGGMVSFEIKGGEAAARTFLSRLKLITLGESLGGVESLACYPPIMTHASIDLKERIKMGISPGLIRLSLGIESAQDLIRDLNQAFLKRKN